MIKIMRPFLLIAYLDRGFLPILASYVSEVVAVSACVFEFVLIFTEIWLKIRNKKSKGTIHEAIKVISALELCVRIKMSNFA